MAAGQFDEIDNLRLAVISFGVDRVTAEVVTAFEEASIPSILVKGPTIATWLYSAERPRLYGDTDLLLRKGDWGRAHEIMKQLGFQDDLGPLEHPRMESGDGFLFVRLSDEACVDLHYTFFGIGAPPETLWDAYVEGAIKEPIGGIEVLTPPKSARLLHIALHAVQHGGEAAPKPMADLRQALDNAPEATWLEALSLAERLDALEAFAAGLRLNPKGKQLSEAIGVGEARSTAAVLRLEGVPMAEGMQQLADASGPRQKLRIVASEAFPNRTFMRWWTPLAHRGPIGLALAYVWRIIWLSYRAIPGYLAWRRAKRTANSKD